jgi:hypothetical protein
LMITALGDELVIMHIQSGNYIGLNKIGVLIWNMMEHPVRVSSIVACLVESFDVLEEDCYLDTQNYLQQMLSQDIAFIV